MNKINKISIIVPCYNEEKIIDKSLENIIKSCDLTGYNYEIIVVDDGSTDCSEKKLRLFRKNNKKIKILSLSKNFGAHIAISAGIDFVDDPDFAIVIPMDDFELSTNFKLMIEKYNLGSDIVWSVRSKRSQNFINNFLTRIFYKIFIAFSGFVNYPEKGTSAFFLLSRKVIKEFRKLSENNRNVNVLIFSMGFKQDNILYNELNTKRKSSYTFFKKIKIAIDSIISNSYIPMRLASLIGIIFSLISLIYLLSILKDYFFNNISVEGWTSIIAVVTLIGGVQMLTLGFLGEYLWRTSFDAKKRPLYFINEKIGFNEN
jgi:glycosyltransferase involved in cell wall biosynthesis